MMKECYSNSLIYTLVNICGSFIVIGISILKQYIDTDLVSFNSIVRTGDILIICTSMTITAIYSFYTFKNEIRNGWPSVFFWGAILNYTVSLIFYFNLPFKNSAIKIETRPNLDSFFCTITLLVFIFNMLTTYFSAYYQNANGNANVVDDRNKQTDVLQERFKNTMESV